VQKAEKARRTASDKEHGIYASKTEAKALIREQLHNPSSQVR